MADTFFEKSTRCAKVCGLFFLMLIGWAGKLWSRGKNESFYGHLLLILRVNVLDVLGPVKLIATHSYFPVSAKVISFICSLVLSPPWPARLCWKYVSRWSSNTSAPDFLKVIKAALSARQDKFTLEPMTVGWWPPSIPKCVILGPALLTAVEADGIIHRKLRQKSDGD